MLYILSRVLGGILQPSWFILIVLVGSALSLLLRPTRAGRICAGICICLLGLCAWTPVGAWLMGPLEERFPRPPPPREVTGIIVLGGAFDMSESYSRNMVALNYRAERMTAFAGLARRYPHATLVFSGGNASYSGIRITEASLARRLFVDLGIPLNRVIFEDKSRNTHENALYSHRLVRVHAADTWLLVTSAADMPRAVGSFRGVGWNVVPIPVDFHTKPSFWATPGLIDGLREIDWSTHEWVGLLYYFLRGWTPELFPGPSS